MENQQIIAKLKQLVKPHLEYQDDSVIDNMTGNTNLLDELGLDSVDLVEIIMDIEESFDISIKDEEIQQVKTVNDLVALIKSKQEA